MRLFFPQANCELIWEYIASKNINKVVPFPIHITMSGNARCDDLAKWDAAEWARDSQTRRVNYFQTISGYDRLIARYAIIGRIYENQSAAQKDTVKRPLFARLSTRATT